MTTLRSGKAIPVEDPKKDKQPASLDPKLSQITSHSKEVMEETNVAKEKEDGLPVYKPVAPFPQRLKQPKQMTPNQES